MNTNKKKRTLVSLVVALTVGAANILTNIHLFKKNGYTWDKEKKQFIKPCSVFTQTIEQAEMNSKIFWNNYTWSCIGFVAGLITYIHFRNNK